jgi:uncharacterized membrane protein HdeD (DUF308 family)
MNLARCPVLYALMRNWWAVALRGAAAVLFGVAIAAWPGPAALAMVRLFAAHAAADGVLALLVALVNRSRHEARQLLLLEGLVSLTFAGLAAGWPGATAILLVLAVGARAVTLGVLQLLAARALRRELDGEWLLGLCGVANLILGVVIATRMAAPAPAAAWLIALHAVATGVLLAALARRLRRVQAAMTRVLSKAA